MQSYQNDRNQLIQKLNGLWNGDQSKDNLALELFQFQYKYNKTYHKYASLIGKTMDNVIKVSDIPFLPIQLFKQYEVKSGNWIEENIFESSGTTGKISSKHFVKDNNWYLQQAWRGFKSFYSNPEQYCILALLPSYLERGHSSLVAMVDSFIKKSNVISSGFYLDDLQALYLQLEKNEKQNIPSILIGVSYALLDLAEEYPMKLKNTIIMETGGMKGKRKEISKIEMHTILQKAFKLNEIHSEYGMTELFSQAYSTGNGIYIPTRMMDVVIREITDPFSIITNGKTGGINIIDYANLDSCCFIETEDLGKSNKDSSFEVLGRLDAAEIRGCNLMIGDL